MQDMSRAFSMPFIQSPLGHFGAPSPGPGPELPSDDFVELINAPRHVSPDILRVSQDSFGSMHSQRKRKHHTGALGISASMPNGDWLSGQLQTYLLKVERCCRTHSMSCCKTMDMATSQRSHISHTQCPMLQSLHPQNISAVSVIDQCLPRAIWYAPADVRYVAKD